MVLHKIKSESRQMSGGWVHMIPDLRGIEDLVLKHARVVLMIVFDRDSKRHPKKRRYIQDGGISNKNLDIILKAMGLGISQSGRSKSVWVDLENRYLKLRENNPSMVGPVEPISQTGKRYENAKIKNGKRQTVTQPSLELVFDNANSENEKRYENANGFIPTVRLKNKNIPPNPPSGDVREKLESVFAEIWRDYPGYLNGAGRQEKGSRKKAWEKFQKVAKKPEVMEAIQGAVAQLKADFPNAASQNAFRPALVVWLNQARWEEYAAVARPEAIQHDEGCLGNGVIKINGKLQDRVCRCRQAVAP